MSKVAIKIKEPVMIGGQAFARDAKVTVDADDAALVVGMGRAEYVKADAKAGAKTGDANTGTDSGGK